MSACTRFATVSVALLAALAAACGSSSDRAGFDEQTAGTDPSGGAGGPSGTIGGGGGAPGGATPTGAECEKMDIVFVVDDSGSMAEEQANLAANFPKFVAVLDKFKTKKGTNIDYRIAVTTTGRDVTYKVELLPGFPGPSTTEQGDDGAFRDTKTCGVTKRWIDKADPNVATTFACLAEVGTDGPGLEMPLYALKLALVDRMADGTNKGFLRDDALLATVILTDEDDCSREDNNFTLATDACEGSTDVRPVAEYASMLDTVAKGKGRWATAVIAGEKACKSSFGDAAEAKRLKDFVSIAGKNGTFSSICDGDLSVALEKALTTFDAACKDFAPVR